MLSGDTPNGNDAGPPGDKASDEAASLIDLLLQQARGKLDHIDEPTAAELDAIENLDDDLGDVDEAPPEPVETQPALALLAGLAELDKPELVSFEGLDDAETDIDAAGDEVEELLDDAETMIEDYIDVDLKDDELEDEGYDLDDDDIGSYSDLYGDDDTIVPSFREGEFVEEDEPDTAYYDDMR